ncbi:MAG: hypothetical protein ACXIUL_06100 [Wenzhouxiangella sp.]
MFRALRHSSLAALLLILLTACGGDSANNSQLSQFDTRIPDAIAQHVPIPEEATVRMSMVRDDGMSVMFSPGISWPASIDFFSRALPAHGWTVDEEDLPSEHEGEREARWIATGHGHQLRVSVNAFGGEQGFNMTGFILLQPQE